MDIVNSADLGAIVRRQRKANGLSQTELAQLLGTTRQWLSRFEQGSNDVSLGTAFAALSALDIKLSFAEPLVTSADSPPEPEDIASLDQEKAFADNLAERSAFSVADSTRGDNQQELALDIELPIVSVVQGEPVAPVEQSKPANRFDRMRERDSLSGLSSRLRATNAQSPTGASGADEEEYEPTPIRPARPAHYSIDDDIARIAKSTLFKR